MCTVLAWWRSSPEASVTGPDLTSHSPTSQLKPAAAKRALSSCDSWLGGKRRLQAKERHNYVSDMYTCNVICM